MFRMFHMFPIMGSQWLPMTYILGYTCRNSAASFNHCKIWKELEGVNILPQRMLAEGDDYQKTEHEGWNTLSQESPQAREQQLYSNGCPSCSPAWACLSKQWRYTVGRHTWNNIKIRIQRGVLSCPLRQELHASSNWKLFSIRDKRWKWQKRKMLVFASWYSASSSSWWPSCS